MVLGKDTYESLYLIQWVIASSYLPSFLYAFNFYPCVIGVKIVSLCKLPLFF